MATSRDRSAQRACKEIQQWVADDDDDYDASEFSEDEGTSAESSPESEDAIENESQHESEFSGSESDADEQPDAADYMSKNKKVKWSNSPFAAPQGRRSKCNVVQAKRAVVLGNKSMNEPSDSVELFLDAWFFDKLLKHTNEELGRRRLSTREKEPKYLDDFTTLEIKAAVGLTILIGVMCSKRESLRQLWSDVYGRPILRATMPLNRFQVFLSSARFDDKTSRIDRQQNDKLAAIREFFDNFVEKCKAFYVPSPYVCVDETLVGFRGRCAFRVYIPSKPDRYGIKIWSLCDNGTHYVSNLQVYLGKEGPSPEQQQGARVVRQLTSHLYGTGRNVTTDNFFTSYDLGQFLLSHNLTLLGTMRKNRTELPPEFLPKTRQQFESKFAFTNNTALVSYAPRKNKTVVLLSTMHSKPDTYDEVEECKPYMILDYNMTKGAVDSFDQKTKYYTCAHKSRRWPMRLFYFLIDATCLNAFVIWNMKNPTWKDQKGSKRLDKRRLFLTEVAHSLMKPMITQRAESMSISHQPSVARAMLAVGVQPTQSTVAEQLPKKRGRCQSCPRHQEQKVEHRCTRCRQFVCGKHGKKNLTYTCMKCPLTLENSESD
jgi:hypothetical protein